MLGLMIGMIGLFGTVILGAIGMMHLLDVFFVILGMMVVGVITAIMLLLDNLMTQGILDVFINARMSGDPVAVILRNDKAIRFAKAKFEGGMGVTKRYGYYNIIPDSVYNFQNGAIGFIAYFKQGLSLPAKFVKICTRLKDSGITDVNQLEHFSQRIVLDKDMKPVLNPDGTAMQVRDLEIGLDAQKKER